jgi:hypothetical protein
MVSIPPGTSANTTNKQVLGPGVTGRYAAKSEEACFKMVEEARRRRQEKPPMLRGRCLARSERSSLRRAVK